MKKITLVFLCSVWLAACSSSDWARVLDEVAGAGNSSAALTDSEISMGLKEALRIGSGLVVTQLGAKDGFNLDPTIHIPLPERVAKLRDTLARIGLDAPFNELELKLNRAAEAATPKAKALFLDAIQQMTWSDVRNILGGEDDAATRFFQDKMSPDLARLMKPIVDSTLANVGALQAYDQAIAAAGPAGQFLPDYRADLGTQVVQLGMDGIFHYLAQEEAAIRSDPIKRTTEILRRVFGR